MIKNILWDFDGTLFDTYPACTAAFLAALNDYGFSTHSAHVSGLALVSLGHAARVLAQEFDLDEQAFLARFSTHHACIDPKDQPPYAGVMEICQAICSSGGVNLVATHRRRETAQRLLDIHGMSHLFAGLLTTGDGFPEKPDPAMFEALIQKYALNKKDTLAVGDRELDILAAQAAGLRSCFFGTNPCEARPDYSINHYEELKRLISA